MPERPRVGRHKCTIGGVTRQAGARNQGVRIFPEGTPVTTGPEQVHTRRGDDRRVVPDIEDCSGAPVEALCGGRAVSALWNTLTAREGVTAGVNNRADCSLVQKLGCWKSAEVFEKHYGEDSTAAGAWVMTLSINTAQ
ncbi:hypothetical protein VOLCADRAFT_93142 [Volvox carteri f. nagariensis]|uniref:Uncharacterized protein n=1 Tax=Volvox carteri f. nagariensis TaxID=3068 RepID=D8U1E8_VOLCA|nr:uncharacterized protein VOLCADRAFT_93142 [Volvox carteri f. nagariensis]EFJ46400.1 hypothetical protein VOLCADRAFT_93142 [Volvox carteri f. nagariensis]|eukprot:XP_002952553.1 hypothetical protein VOLCADRAFT_93142 [Volvox carteri f. nagariensis]